MARKSGRNFRKKAIHRGVASTTCHSTVILQMRRRHKFKSHSHRQALLKDYFLKSETNTEKLNTNKCIPEYRFSTDIPENYDETYICTLPINPDFLYTYWEFASDDLEQINGPKADVKLSVRLRKISPVETDLLNFPDNCIADDPDIFEKNTDSVPVKESTVEVSNEITTTIGDLITQAPVTGELYIMDFVKPNEAEDEILIASHEIISNISPTCEYICDSTDESNSTNEYFGDDNECIKEKNSELQINKSENLKQYLGSASYES